MTFKVARRFPLRRFPSICTRSRDVDINSLHRLLQRNGSFRTQKYARAFSNTRYFLQHHQQQHRKETFSSRLRTALKGTKVEWKPIPIGLGIAFLGGLQFYRTTSRERQRIKEEEEEARFFEHENGHRPMKRPRVRPSGPWYVNTQLLKKIHTLLTCFRL
jgi:hypothetical protein